MPKRKEEAPDITSVASTANNFSHNNDEHTKLLLDYVQAKEDRNKLDQDIAKMYDRISNLYKLGVLDYDKKCVELHVTESKIRIPWKEKFREHVGEDVLANVEKENTELTTRIWVVRINEEGKSSPIPPIYRDKTIFKVIK